MKQGLTTQKAEALLSSVVKATDNIKYDVKLTRKFIQDQVWKASSCLSCLS